MSTCPATSINCQVGYKPVMSVPEGKCCPEYSCGENLNSASTTHSYLILDFLIILDFCLILSKSQKGFVFTKKLNIR